jgi:pimeloyl-ACP methyl ester carboxylesterase
VVLVGHSMGGDVILEAARQVRSRSVGLIWMDAYRTLPVVRSPAEIQELMAPFRADFVGWTRSYVRELFPPAADAALVERIVSDVSSAPPAVAIPALESAFQYAAQVPRALADLRLPIAQINPDDGTTNVVALKRHGVEVHLLRDVGHFPFLEAPEACNRMLKDMLESMNALG